tara:strand:- start:184 stop:498 length:315 start_codon:yes stop_codon:yes gene_type:complete
MIYHAPPVEGKAIPKISKNSSPIPMSICIQFKTNPATAAPPPTPLVLDWEYPKWENRAPNSAIGTDNRQQVKRKNGEIRLVISEIIPKTNPVVAIPLLGAMMIC